jgi:hypothetical protein
LDLDRAMARSEKATARMLHGKGVRLLSSLLHARQGEEKRVLLPVSQTPDLA